VRLGHQTRLPVGDLEFEHSPRTGRVASRIRQRFLRDAKECDAHGRRNSCEIPVRLQLDGQAVGPYLVDESANLRCRRERSHIYRLVLTAEQRNRPAQLPHASTAQLLGRPQRLLGCREVATQHVSRARDLEHHSRQPVANEIMDIPGDPAPFQQQRLLRKLAPGCVEPGSELGLTRQRVPDHPGKGDTQDADAHIDLGRVLNRPLNHRRSHR
jgi:hypothetical protein